MFSNAKAGDRVWSFVDGFGEVVWNALTSPYSVRVRFCGGAKISFTKQGKACPNDLHPTLFWDEIVFEVPKKPLPKLEVDTKVLVWDVDKPKNKLVRYFCSFDASGRVVVFQHGTTSFSCEGYTEIWSEWEVYKEHESE